MAFLLNNETIIHSDQGTQKTSTRLISLLKDRHLRQSMSQRSNYRNNAPQESFYGHMNDELAGEIVWWESYEDVKRSIDDWIDDYS